MILEHWSLVDPKIWTWNNFEPDEPGLACPHCGEFYFDPAAMDAIQTVRDLLGRPVHINSGHRCWYYNALPRIGGAPLSEHKRIAFDIDLTGHNRRDVLEACRAAGFGSFGYYRTFLHTDRRPGRQWYGKGARKLWTGLV